MQKLKAGIFVLLLTVGCAASVAKPDQPRAKAQVRLLSISPAAGSEVSEETVLVAEIEYAIQNYKPGVDYYIAPVFASNKGSGVTFSMMDRFSDAPRISTPEGKMTIRYGIERELKSEQLARPIKVLFFLMERIGSTQTQVAGQTGPLEYTTR